MKKRHVEKEKEEVVVEEGLEPGVSAGYHRKQPGLNSRRKTASNARTNPPYEQGYWKEGLFSTESDIATSRIFSFGSDQQPIDEHLLR